jgi:adenosylcobinamide-GDP ribazoletransferase
MAHQLRLLLAALRVYTRVPFIARLHGVTSDVPTRAGDAIRYLPIAGLLVAIAQSAVYMFASIVLPHAVALLLAIGAGLILTGACHEVGWARFCTMLGERPAARSTNDDAIDSASASTALGWAVPGAVGVMLLLMLRFESLAHLDADWIAASLICAATFSRACAVIGSARASATDALIAMLLGAAPLALLALWTDDNLPGLLGLSIALISTALVRRLIRRSGAMHARASGDTAAGTRSSTDPGIGAVQQIAEAGFLLGLLIALEAGPDDTVNTDDEMEPEE